MRISTAYNFLFGLVIRNRVAEIKKLGVIPHIRHQNRIKSIGFRNVKETVNLELNKTKSMDIVNEILKWPVIIQGALGSFLFWLLFTIGQKIFSLSSKKLKDENELGSFFGRSARDDYKKKDYNGSNYMFFTCIYASIHYLIKFILTAFISFIIADLIPVFAYVGYLIAIYFIFRALSYVTHFRTFEKEDERREKQTK